MRKSPMVDRIRDLEPPPSADNAKPSIKTDHKFYELKYRHEVPAQVLADRFDWTNDEDHFDGYFCYRKWWYHISEFTFLGDARARAAGASDCADPFAGWHAYHADSYFSGVVIKLSKDGERVLRGTYFA